MIWRAASTLFSAATSESSVTNPLKLRSSNPDDFTWDLSGMHRSRVCWNATPIAATLIRYEQAKRSYYNYEDSVWQLLRSEIRQLQANRFTFELGRELIRNSAEQIELNADQRALREARGQIVGPTAARDQIQALSALLNAQNGLLGIYVNYEVVRRGLELDLGTMELTPEGLWIDPGTLSPEELLSLPGTTVEGMIECPCNDCGIPYNPLPPEPVFSNTMLQVGHIDQAVEIVGTGASRPARLYRNFASTGRSAGHADAANVRSIAKRRATYLVLLLCPS